MAIEHVTDENFANKTSEGLVVADFWAPWCGPCKMIAPVLEEIDSELSDKVKIVKLNTDENQQVTGQYGVMSIPTLIVFKDGEIVDKVVGFQPKEALVERLQQQF
ncbi:thioredoxin [Pullulanibacillus sp. KACC 23026]|uniref:thioredoxin n=1 Tax=Pullulanibacillus sp. KACC 23026 TaxID=3028315 RepID=UPI0023B16378|nr:thioredoxin [Pullulanibacillus sp. KACC 23026]WEG13942.1 thioredoxin [Pullulanibacillus sp. KACC 23026]